MLKCLELFPQLMFSRSTFLKEETEGFVLLFIILSINLI